MSLTKKYTFKQLFTESCGCGGKMADGGEAKRSSHSRKIKLYVRTPFTGNEYRVSDEVTDEIKAIFFNQKDATDYIRFSNMHDEFVERIKKAVKDLSRPHSDGSIALHELQQLLKQAEQK